MLSCEGREFKKRVNRVVDEGDEWCQKDCVWSFRLRGGLDFFLKLLRDA